MKLLHGDCLEILPSLAAGSIDVVVTSPPYNLGIQYNSFRDTAPREEYLAWCRHDASFFLNVGSAPANPLMPHQLILELSGGNDPLFTLQNTFHGIKSITIRKPDGAQTSAGSGAKKARGGMPRDFCQIGLRGTAQNFWLRV